MKKLKQILAIIGIVLLLSMYIVTFLLAVCGNKNTTRMFNAAIICTIVIPIFLWGIITLTKAFKDIGSNSANKNK